MKALLIFLCSLFFASAALAQTIVKDAIVVNGLQVGERYTQEQIVKALGTPSKIVSPSETDEYPNVYTFYYNQDRFYLIDGKLYGFELRTSAFVVNGSIRIGDAVSKVNQLGGCIEKRSTALYPLINWRPTKEGLYEWTSVSFYYNKHNVIDLIDAFVDNLY